MAERAAAQDDPDRERAQREVALDESADAGSGADEQRYVNGAAGAVRPPPEPLERGGGAPEAGNRMKPHRITEHGVDCEPEHKRSEERRVGKEGRSGRGPE